MAPRSGFSSSVGMASTRSCPERNARPLPVSSTARTEPSPRILFSAVTSSPDSARLNAFRTVGRFSVSVVTPSFDSTSSVWPASVGIRGKYHYPRPTTHYPLLAARLLPVTPSSSPSARKTRPARPTERFDWRRIAYHVLVSRALDDVEEVTNKNKATVPREHLVLYQFSARGHDVAQVILGALLDHPHDAAGAYYRSRPLLLSLGLSIEDALASPLGRSGGFSGGRDIGVVCNLPNR